MTLYRTALTALLATLLPSGCFSADEDPYGTAGDPYGAFVPIGGEAGSMAGPATPPSGVQGVSFRRYSEQNEQAYSFEAPEGWQVQSALDRKSPIAWRTWDSVRSPDGQIAIQGGNPERYMFVEPSQMTQQAGMREGSSPDGITYVARYQDGATFGRSHLQQVAPCRNIELAGQRPRPDEAQRVMQKAKKAGNWVQGAQIDAVEVSFTCRGERGPLAGRMMSMTVRMGTPGGPSMWFGGLRVAVAPQERIGQAAAIMEHMARSHQENPQWKARQRATQQRQAQMSQNQHQQRMAQRQASFNAHQKRMGAMSAAQDAQFNSWQQQQRVGDQMHDQFVGSIRDETRVWDSRGNHYDVPMGGDTYYIDNAGDNIIGTPGHMDNPDPMRFEQMAEGYEDPYRW